MDWNRTDRLVALLAVTTIFIINPISVPIETALIDKYELDIQSTDIERINRIQSSWRAGPNLDPRMRNNQRFRRLMGLVPNQTAFDTRLPRVTRTRLEDIPDSFDSRQNWPNCTIIGEIRNQGECGSCWAVSTAAAISDRICIESGGTVMTPISAIDLACCDDGCYSDEFCSGGQMLGSWNYFQNSGLVTGGELDSEIGCKPYMVDDQNTVECQQSCTNDQYQKSYQDDLNQGSSAYTLDPDVGQIQSEIMEHGSVTASMQVYDDFKLYQSGVYFKTDDSIQVGLHAVRVIGWGNDGDDSGGGGGGGGGPYWLVANSWGTDWGDGGFFKIRLGTNECNIESAVCAGRPSISDLYSKKKPFL